MIKLKSKPLERKERTLSTIKSRRRIKRRCSNIGRLARMLTPTPKFRFVKPLTFICDEHRLILFITNDTAIKERRFEEQIKSCAEKNIVFIPIENRKLTTALRRIDLAVMICEKTSKFKLA